MYTGRDTIEWLYGKQLQVDDEWSVITENGFTWWAGDHAQTVEVVGEADGPSREPLSGFSGTGTNLFHRRRNCP